MTGEALDRCSATGKAMRTQAENSEWLSQYRARKSPRQPRLRGYVCEVCGAWHVTHIQSKIAKAKIIKKAKRGRG